MRYEALEFGKYVTTARIYVIERTSSAACRLSDEQA